MTGVGAPTEIALHHVILRKEDSLVVPNIGVPSVKAQRMQFKDAM